jgi:hypothetical protein
MRLLPSLARTQSPRDSRAQDDIVERASQERERPSTEVVGIGNLAARRQSTRLLVRTQDPEELQGVSNESEEEFGHEEVEAWRESGRKEAGRVIEIAKQRAIEVLERSSGPTPVSTPSSVAPNAKVRGYRNNIMAVPLSVGQAEVTGLCACAPS